MIQQDFYTGEPVVSGSPPNFSQTAEYEAANQAAVFGMSKYDTNPNVRQPITMMPTTIYPGGYGYNTPGIGNNGGYSPYGNINPTYGQYYNQGYCPNPMLIQQQQMMQQQQYYQQQQMMQQQQRLTYDVPGVGVSGEFLPPTDYEDKLDQLASKYWFDQQNIDAKASVDRQGSIYGYYNNGGYNYYGMGYFNNPWQYNSINMELQQELNNMKDEAREARIQFDMKISRLAHNLAGEHIADDELEKRYRGTSVPIPDGYVNTMQGYQVQQRYNNCVPFDNSQYYRDQYIANNRIFNDTIKPDMDMKETFLNLGVVWANWEMEDEMHRRKDGSGLYRSGDNTYKYYVRKKAQERYAAEKGVAINNKVFGSTPQQPNINQMRQDYANSLPTLAGNAFLSDDGTLNIRCNFGQHAGETYHVHNGQEAEYDEKRDKFYKYIDSIPSSIYLDGQKQEKKDKYNYG